MSVRRPLLTAIYRIARVANDTSHLHAPAGGPRLLPRPSQGIGGVLSLRAVVLLVEGHSGPQPQPCTGFRRSLCLSISNRRCAVLIDAHPILSRCKVPGLSVSESTSVEGFPAPVFCSILTILQILPHFTFSW